MNGELKETDWWLETSFLEKILKVLNNVTDAIEIIRGLKNF